MLFCINNNYKCYCKLTIHRIPRSIITRKVQIRILSSTYIIPFYKPCFLDFTYFKYYIQNTIFSLTGYRKMTKNYKLPFLPVTTTLLQSRLRARVFIGPSCSNVMCCILVSYLTQVFLGHFSIVVVNHK